MNFFKRAAQIGVDILTIPVSFVSDTVSMVEQHMPSTVITLRKIENHLDEISTKLGED